MELAGTGIPEVDRLMGGGCPRGHTVLLEADVGTAYEHFLFAIATQALARKEHVYYASFSQPHNYVVRLAESVSPEILTHLGKSFVILDFQTKEEKGLDDIGQSGYVSVADPNNPSQVAALLERLAATRREERRGAVAALLATISDMTMRFGFSPTYQMLGRLNELVRENEWVAFGVMHPKMHQAQEVAAMEHLSDGIIQLTARQVGTKLQKYFQVTSMRGLPYSSEMVPYEMAQGRLALWTRLVEDFEAMKASLTIEADGTLRVVGTPGQFISETSLANLTSIILEKVGYETGGRFLYDYTRRTSPRTVEALGRSQGLSGLDLLKAYFKLSEVTGSGTFVSIDFDSNTGIGVIKGWNLIPRTLRLGQPIHFRDAGAIAGALGFITGKPYEVEEAMCTSKGDALCEFTCRPLPLGRDSTV